MLLTDKQFYKAALDLRIPELAECKKLFFEGKEEEAHRLFAKYVRENLDYEKFYTLQSVQDFYSHNTDEQIIAVADKAAAGYVSSCGVSYLCEDLKKIDWSYNPTENNYGEFVWQLSRHGNFTHIARAWELTKDEKYLNTYITLISTWLEQEEFPIADVANGHYSPCFVGWRTIESGVRMRLPWHYPIHAFMKEGVLPDRLVVDIFKSFWEHAFHIRNYCSSHNWLTIELGGFMHIAAFYPFFECSDKWRQFIFDRLHKELSVQLHADFMQYELATGYHMVVIGDYKRVMAIADRYGFEISETMKSSVRKMYGAITKILQPDRHIPDLNDGTDRDFRGDLADAEWLYPNDPEFRYFLTDGKEGKAPAYLSTVLPYTGFCAMRTGWEQDAIYALFDGAHHGWGHQHEDKLAFNLAAYGKNLLMDGGNYDYDASKMRRMLISTYGHNTGVVDTFGQNNRKTHSRAEEERCVREHIPSDLSWNFSEDVECCAAAYRLGYGEDLIPVDHERKVIFFKKGIGGSQPFFVLLDDFAAKDAHEHLCEVLFQLGREPITEAETTVTADHGDGVSLTLVSSGAREIAIGQYEPRYTGWRKKYAPGAEHEHYPAPAIYFSGKGESVSIATAVYPAKDAACPIASVACDSQCFTLAMANGECYTFDKNDPAFKTYGTIERLEKGMDICL